MTRLLTEGFELQDYVGWSVLSGSGSIRADVKRSGSTCLALGGQAIFTRSIGVSRSELYFRVGFMRNTWGGTGTSDAGIFEWRNGASILGKLHINSYDDGSNTLKLYIGTTLVKSAYYKPTLYIWNLYEVHVILHDTNGLIEVKAEGVLQPGLTYSGDTKPDSNTTMDTIALTTVLGGYMEFNDMLYDDIAINDTNGTVDNSWCGDGKVIKTLANGTVTNQLVGSDGDSVNNHLLVDEVPKDSDTTYVQGNVVDEEDLYDFAASGLASTCTINRIWVEARSRNTVASGRKVALVTKASGGSEVVGSDVTLSTSYDIKVLSEEQTQNPVTSQPWTVADVDALQAGVRTRS